MTRYEIDIKEIENGWLFTVVLSLNKHFQRYFATELEALSAASLTIKEAMELTRGEKSNDMPGFEGTSERLGKLRVRPSDEKEPEFEENYERD